MPQPMMSPLGKRQPRAVVVGLRRVVKDPKATPAQVLKACELLAILEGYIPGRLSEQPARGIDSGQKRSVEPSRPTTSPENEMKLRGLLEMMRAEEENRDHPAHPEQVLPT